MNNKPGYMTTEFWVTILTLILNNLNALPIPDRYQGIINAVLPVGYALARGLAKITVPQSQVFNNTGDAEAEFPGGSVPPPA